MCVRHLYAPLIGLARLRPNIMKEKKQADYLSYKAPSLRRQFLGLMSLKHSYSLFNLNSVEKLND